MRARIAVALAVTLAGCAPQSGQPARTTAPPPTAPRATWPQQMDVARRMASEGKAYVVVGPSLVVAFYNNPQPFASISCRSTPPDAEPGRSR